jgi:hypothetical protein
MFNTDTKKKAINVTVRLTATQITHIKNSLGIRGGSNEIAIKALVNSVANKKLKVW